MNGLSLVVNGYIQTFSLAKSDIAHLPCRTLPLCMHAYSRSYENVDGVDREHGYRTPGGIEFPASHAAHPRNTICKKFSACGMLASHFPLLRPHRSRQAACLIISYPSCTVASPS